MPEIAEPLSPVRVLAKPKKFEPLRRFSCGRQGSRWEKLVNEWVRSVYLGTQIEAQTVVVLEDRHGKLIGVSSFRPRPVPGSEGIAERVEKLTGAAQYIQMLGIDRHYHGQRLQDSSRLGDVLLRGTLDQIALTCGGRLPAVWAHVTPENARARALFARHDFNELPYSGEGEISCVLFSQASLVAPSARLGSWMARLRGKPRSSFPPRSDTEAVTYERRAGRG